MSDHALVRPEVVVAVSDLLQERRWHGHCLLLRHIEAPTPPTPGQLHMKRNSIWHSLRLVIASLGLTACAADTVTAPRISNEANQNLVSGLVGGLFKKNALTRKTALSKDITVTAVIGKDGGRLSIPAAGFELTIPKNAVKTNTTFTVTAIKGKLVAYEFGPHGLTFQKNLEAKQDLSGTEYRLVSGLLKPLVAGYFLQRSDLDQGNAVALVLEVIKGLTVPLTQTFSFDIEHFSGYVVAW